jgi:hypothetical protein
MAQLGKHMDNVSDHGDLAAIVCSHVAREGLPILGAVRAEPQDPADSGWQFMCYSGKDESIEEAQVWSLSQVIQHEQTLRPFIASKTGTRITRLTKSSEWIIQE